VVLRLRGPIAERGHVYVRESGASSRLRFPLLGGIALRFATFLPRRHFTDLDGKSVRAARVEARAEARGGARGDVRGLRQRVRWRRWRRRWQSWGSRNLCDAIATLVASVQI
jgi:hypothetical protein